MVSATVGNCKPGLGEAGIPRSPGATGARPLTPATTGSFKVLPAVAGAFLLMPASAGGWGGR